MRKNWLLLSMTASLVTSLIVGAGCKSMGDHDHEDEVKMAFADVPQAVQATLKAETSGATITTVDLETRHGKKVYEADAMVAGKNWEICVDESGKLISKKEDNEKEDDDKSGK